jgi:peptidylprolyl isomerase
MKVGEKKTVTIAPDQGYGDHVEEMIITVPRSEIPDELEPEVGMQLELTNEEDEPIVVIITDMSDDLVTLDGNPPLAGETLTFDLELVAIG